jgi:hypothetical protein
MTNYVGTTGNTVHMAANTRTARWACRPRTELAPCVAGTTQTDAAVTCGSCLRVARRAHELADALVTAMAEGRAEAERHTMSSIEHGHVDMFAPAPLLRSALASGVNSVSYWFGVGEVEGVSNAAYMMRRRELELAHLETLAAEAELEAHRMNVCDPTFGYPGRMADVDAAHELANRINPTGIVTEIGLGQDLQLHTRTDWTTSTLHAEALVMDRELDLAKDEVFERPEITTPDSVPTLTGTELAEQVARCRRLAQRHIDRGQAAEAAEYWFAMWMARREISYRAQLLPADHVYAERLAPPTSAGDSVRRP